MMAAAAVTSRAPMRDSAGPETLTVVASSKLAQAAAGLLSKQCMQVHILPLSMLGFVTASEAQHQRCSSPDRLSLMVKHLKLSLSIWWHAQLRQQDLQTPNQPALLAVSIVMRQVSKLLHATRCGHAKVTGAPSINTLECDAQACSECPSLLPSWGCKRLRQQQHEDSNGPYAQTLAHSDRLWELRKPFEGLRMVPKLSRSILPKRGATTAAAAAEKWPGQSQLLSLCIKTAVSSSSHDALSRPWHLSRHLSSHDVLSAIRANL